ncbi:MFS transporter [Actinomadura terrae]|uniref:MFS transporter n=1 Tax=Actinomadura terrae TaxID=604353 RepID=UPI001FA74AA6|nr:MFS transporter [Actinomadura terrae]
MTADDSSVQARYRDVFAIGEFRLLFLDSVFGSAGLALQILALSVFVYDRTHSALMSSIAFGAGFLSQVMGGAAFGSLADLLRPRVLIVAGDLTQAAVAAVLVVAGLPPAGDIAVVAAAASLQPVFRAGREALLPDLLTADRYVLGRSIFNLASPGAQLTALGLGGVMLEATGPRGVLTCTLVSYLLGALVIRIGLRDHPPRAVSIPARSLLGRSWRNNVALLRDRRVRSLLLVQWIPVWLLVGAESLVIPYARDRGGRGGTVGWVLMALPIGMLISNATVGRLFSARAQERLVLPLCALTGLPLLVFIVHPPLWGAALAFGTASIGLGAPVGVQAVFIDSVEEGLRGSLFVLRGTGLTTGQGLTPLLCGTLATFSGPAPAIAAAGAAIALTALLFAGPASSGWR